jgi:hypothetical protein
MKSRSNTRVRQNGSAARAAKQAQTPPANDDLQMLVGANDLTEDALWALPDGRLFLWPGKLDEVPREVTFEQAREWWTKFQSREPYLAAPCFPEHTAADRLVTVVCGAISARKQPARPSTSALPAANGGSFVDMEHPVQSAMALLCMLARRCSDAKESIDDPASTNEACGYQNLAYGCAKALDAEWRESVDDERALREGTARPLLRPGQLPAVMRLNSSVVKASALLKTMANEIATEDDEFEIHEAERKGSEPNIGRNGQIVLAKECSSTLEAAYDAAFDAWDKLDDAARQRAAA